LDGAVNEENTSGVIEVSVEQSSLLQAAAFPVGDGSTDGGDRLTAEADSNRDVDVEEKLSDDVAAVEEPTVSVGDEGKKPDSPGPEAALDLLVLLQAARTTADSVVKDDTATTNRDIVEAIQDEIEAVGGQVEKGAESYEDDQKTSEEAQEDSGEAAEANTDQNDTDVPEVAITDQADEEKTVEETKAESAEEETVTEENKTEDAPAEADATTTEAAPTETEVEAPKESSDKIDIDLEDPDVEEAARKIQAGFKGYKTRQELKSKEEADGEES